MTRRLGRIAVGVAIAASFLAVPARAYAVTAVPCEPLSLSIAIVNAAPGAKLSLAKGCVYNYTDVTKWTSDAALPHIDKTLTIVGNGATIQRDPAASSGFRVLAIDPSGTLTLSHVTIQHGSVGASPGGGLFIDTGATLKAAYVTVTDNFAQQGAGIGDMGTLSFSHGAINANTATFGGGGLLVDTATAALKATSVSNNFVDGSAATHAFGGGILIAGVSHVTLASTHVDNNTASAQSGGFAAGGGISSADSAGTVSIASSSVQFNRAYGGGGAALGIVGAEGGGVWNNGALQVKSSHLDYNTAIDGAVGARGGGFFNAGGGPTIGGSTVTHNLAAGPGADGGGIFRDAGTVAIPSTTVADNDPNNCGSPSTVPGCV